ncbi:uncharacterized protein LOC119727543 [Patiria miniata]|uniref:Farnesoic acid O-methyl transferase domain-containing protein n=1 Tax=Patiria miniata TaxID=46514 RepID=A0A913ZV03_PATMI|nr:uncharacterized protein LOC119727543 [Patiria miniata]
MRLYWYRVGSYFRMSPTSDIFLLCFITVVSLQAVAGCVCYVGQQSNQRKLTSSWVVLSRDPCGCSGFVPGGFNAKRSRPVWRHYPQAHTRTPGPIFTTGETDDSVKVKLRLGCPDAIAPNTEEAPTAAGIGTTPDIDENSNTEPIPNDATKTISQGVTESTLNIMTKSIPNITTELTPNIATKSIPNIATESTPNILTKSVPNIATESTPNIVTKSIPNIATESTPNILTKSVPNIATESTPNIVTKSIPNIATESTPNIVTKSVPNIATESTPNIGTKSIPNIATESTPNIGTKSVPNVATESTPNLATKFIPNSATEFDLKLATEIFPNLSATEPNIVTKSVPNVSATESTPNLATKSIPNIATEESDPRMATSASKATNEPPFDPEAPCESWVYHTTLNTYTYVFPFAAFDPDQEFFVKFGVRTGTTALLALTVTDKNPQGLEEELYEIVIDYEFSGTSGIRRCKDCESLVSATDAKDRLDEDAYKYYWLRYRGGLVQVGRRGETESFMTWQDDAPLSVRYLGLASNGWDSGWKMCEGMVGTK